MPRFPDSKAERLRTVRNPDLAFPRCAPLLSTGSWLTAPDQGRRVGHSLEFIGMATMHSTALRDYFGRLFGANPNRVGNPPEAEQDPSGEALPAAPNPPRFPEVTIPHLEAESCNRRLRSEHWGWASRRLV